MLVRNEELVQVDHGGVPDPPHQPVVAVIQGGELRFRPDLGLNRGKYFWNTHLSPLHFYLTRQRQVPGQDGEAEVGPGLVEEVLQHPLHLRPHRVVVEN